MKILFVSHFFPPKFNAGTETYTLELALSFLNKGYEVTVVCAEDWSFGDNYLNEISSDVYEGIPVIRLHLNWEKASNPNKILYDSEKIERWFGEFLSHNQFDVVHITSTMTLGIGVMRSIKRSNIPMVLTLMDFWFVCPNNQLIRANGDLCDGSTTSVECEKCMMSMKESHVFQKVDKHPITHDLSNGIWNFFSKQEIISRTRGFRGMLLNMDERKRLLPEALSLPDILISHSEFLSKLISHQASLPIKVIRNGHDLSWIEGIQKQPSEKIRFIFIGQIHFSKGVHLLVEAFQKANIQKQAQLSIWGDLERNVDYVKRIQLLVKDDPSISFRGKFNHNELQMVFSKADVLVVPSFWYENAPLVIQEAFAVKIPVITTNLGGMAEAVKNEVSGLLFERGNVDDLAEKLRKIVLEPNLINKLIDGIPAVKSIEQETVELDRIYNDLVFASENRL